jgi:hypothetical protein
MAKALREFQLFVLIAYAFVLGLTETCLAHPLIVRLFPVTRGRLKSQESDRARRWDNNPSRGYMAMQVTLQSTIK